jgi:hypothetical protein
MPLMRSRHRELGLNLVSLEDDYSFHPKRPPMEKEKRDGRVGDHFKTFLKEDLMLQMNNMMETFSYIL